MLDKKLIAFRYAPLIIVAVSIFMLGFAFTAQYVFDLQPCTLCIWQRWPYGVAMIWGGLATRTAGRRSAALVGLAGLTFAVGAGIAGFHAGVEAHWWEGLKSCSGNEVVQSLEQLRHLLAGKQPVRCDEAAWRFLGISMAGWNFVLSAGYAGATLWTSHAIWRKQ